MATIPAEPHAARSTDELLAVAVRRGRTLRRRRRFATRGVGVLALAGLIPGAAALVDDNDRVVVARDGDSDTSASTTTIAPEPPTVTSTVVDNASSVPNARFVWTPVDPQVGEALSFTDASTGEITSWAWNFGDGGTSSEQNPTHVYEHAGVFPVTLTTTGHAGTSGARVTVEVGAQPSSPAGDGVVPAVVGLLEESALTRIEQAGLTGNVTYVDLEPGSADIGRVIGQSPPPGSMMASHEVTIVVGREVE